MLFGSKKVVGLDIGTSSIKLAELDLGRSGANLVSFAMAPTPPNSINGGEIVDTVAISQAIRALVQHVRSKRKNASVGLWGASVIVKKISLPRMDERMVAEQIRWEAEQYIPFDINDINLEYHILKGRGGESMEILLVGAKRDWVLKHAEVVETAGLQCAVVDVNGFALANCFQYNYGPCPGETLAVLNVGAGVTHFVVLENSEVVFSRDIPVGGATYTQEIQKNLGVSIEEAETLKISACTGQAAPPEVQGILAATNESVVEEIKRTFEFYGATATGSGIQRIFSSGGGSVVPGLLEAIAKTLGVSCEPMNPFQKVTYNTRVFSSEYIHQVVPFVPVAMGLGLRQMGDR